MNNIVSKILIAFIIVILIFGSFVLGYYIGKTPVLSDKISKELVQKEFLDDLREAGFLMPLPPEVKNIEGNIVALDDNSIDIQPVEDTFINPLGAQFPQEMEFLIDGETKFLVENQRNDDEFLQDYEAFKQERDRREQAGESLEGLVEPERYSYEDIEFKDLKLGDLVKIMTGANLLEGEGNIHAQEVIVVSNSDSI